MGIVMAWGLVIIAGLLETGWAVGLKQTDGFTKFWPSLFTILGIVASMLLLSIAARTLPIGTAYAIWVGIGSAGAVILGNVLFGESLGPARVFFLLLLLIAITGLKVTSH
jgi:quaternary ammonium compound-resistance protein SugE